ncbi:DUF5958 family protein [Streptomyces sp. NPDC005141]
MALRDGSASGLRTHQVLSPLVALFSVADTRRRTLHCAGGCGHEWHNLSDPPRDAT